ncbi:cation/H(+) antiporter 15-like [Iris pallida]|uniref:Cation/H(+) antiporter 15-like n=1 Tax=Iris pallida TaxID=29817 RepID=A0AAX6EQB4_IRIPA|nr:cation/H(+) antiporter 15-like [Iris pallida]
MRPITSPSLIDIPNQWLVAMIAPTLATTLKPTSSARYRHSLWSTRSLTSSLSPTTAVYTGRSRPDTSLSSRSTSVRPSGGPPSTRPSSAPLAMFCPMKRPAARRGGR